MKTDNGINYQAHGVMTDPGKYANWVADTPDSPEEISLTVQKNMVHLHWLERYGVKRSDRHFENANVRYVRSMLGSIHTLGGVDLNSVKDPNARTAGTCRDFSVFAAALFRSHGVSARARCGFAVYFNDPSYRFVDHWVCEYHDGAENRWKRLDAQLDGLQTEALSIDFDIADVPENAFIDAAAAWTLIRSGREDPDSFGIFDYKGIPFAAANLARDVAALHKMPLLPWDIWGIMEYADSAGSYKEKDLFFLDSVADAVRSSDEAAVIRLYNDPRLYVPGMIKSYSHSQECVISVSLDSAVPEKAV